MFCIEDRTMIEPDERLNQTRAAIQVWQPLGNPLLKSILPAGESDLDIEGQVSLRLIY
jgi:hypothetical protein